MRFDVETEQPVRNAEGFCIECEPNETGEVIGKILNDPSQAGQPLRGLCRARPTTEKKILRDVFEKGDAWFRTGDLMRKDENGYFYFVDRVGDTFRWKGENVVDHRSGRGDHGVPRHQEANVYGVTLPGHDGRAGMAALVGRRGTRSCGACARICAQQLPDYARPLFLRIRGEIDVTGTFKQKKVELVREGFDPASERPTPIYFNDPQREPSCRSIAPLLRPHHGAAGEDAACERRNHAGLPRPPRRGARLLAGGRPGQMVQQGRRRSMRRCAAISRRPMRPPPPAAWPAGKTTPRARSRCIIVLDQFPRNMFRGEPRTYAADALARAVAARAIARGFDRQFRRPERTFFYLPFMHSEDLADQERCVALIRAAGDANGIHDMPRTMPTSSAGSAVSPIATRSSAAHTTAQEQAFLDAGGFAG